MAADLILSVEDLRVSFRVDKGDVEVVRGVSFTVGAGETLALVGESGSGKSVTSLAILRLTPPKRSSISGRVTLRRGDDGPTDLLALSREAIRDVRGNDIAMIFQEPMTSLNPVHTVGRQLTEAVLFHRNVTKAAATERAVELLDLVGIPEPRQRLSSYPHHLSGGMRQRVMIAMALTCDPRVLIADEPTTALDVTVQAQILELLRGLQERHGMGILLITHDLAVVAETAARVYVMYASRIAEHASVADLFAKPLHPYTVGLFRCLPGVTGKGTSLNVIPGTVPDPSEHPPGCRFHPRCPRAEAICREVDPPLEEKRPGRLCACHMVPAEAAVATAPAATPPPLPSQTTRGED
jgi:oligopeptide transport system ATP-binding protein